MRKIRFIGKLGETRMVHIQTIKLLMPKKGDEEEKERRGGEGGDGGGRGRT